MNAELESYFIAAILILGVLTAVTICAVIVIETCMEGKKTNQQLRRQVEELKKWNVDVEARVSDALMEQHSLRDWCHKLAVEGKELSSTIDQLRAENVELENIMRLVREYVGATKCTCPPPGPNGVVGMNCWHCIFDYNLNFVAAAKGDQTA